MALVATWYSWLDLARGRTNFSQLSIHNNTAVGKQSFSTRTTSFFHARPCIIPHRLRCFTETFCSGHLSLQTPAWRRRNSRVFTSPDSFYIRLDRVAFRQRLSMRLHSVVYAIIAFVMLLVGLEEITWGQILFGWKTPENIAAVNAQNQTTLHNLEFFQN